MTAHQQWLAGGGWLVTEVTPPPVDDNIIGIRGTGHTYAAQYTSTFGVAPTAFSNAIDDDSSTAYSAVDAGATKQVTLASGFRTLRGSANMDNGFVEGLVVFEFDVALKPGSSLYVGAYTPYLEFVFPYDKDTDLSGNPGTLSYKQDGSLTGYGGSYTGSTFADGDVIGVARYTTFSGPGASGLFMFKNGVLQNPDIDSPLLPGTSNMTYFMQGNFV